jgi:hypothetical protein
MKRNSRAVWAVFVAAISIFLAVSCGSAPQKPASAAEAQAQAEPASVVPAVPQQPAPAAETQAQAEPASVAPAVPAAQQTPAPAPAAVAQTKDEILKVAAKELVSLYRENEIRFNKLYLDKKMQVTGELTQVGVSGGKPNLNLKDGSLMGMFVYCNASELDTAGELSKGNTVTVIGTCAVLLGKIILNDCVIKK